MVRGFLSPPLKKRQSQLTYKTHRVITVDGPLLDGRMAIRVFPLAALVIVKLTKSFRMPLSERITCTAWPSVSEPEIEADAPPTGTRLPSTIAT